MKIEVTQNHIDRGTPDNCMLCPVALALEDATGTTWAVFPWSIGPAREDSQGDIEMFSQLDVPEDVLIFMDGFDNGFKVEPFSFELET